MNQILSRENMKMAYKKVKANKGAGGIDGISIEDVNKHLKENWIDIKTKILKRKYKPQPVLRVEIPKPNGGVRNLGIPTVVDRIIEQAIKIKTIQVDNGYEFVNDAEKTNRKTRFQLVAECLGMKVKRTRPYSPWQNGKVERSHREDGKILYGRKIFRSEKELKTAVKKHMQRYNSTAKISLNFKSPNEIVSEYFSKCNICLDN